MVSIQEWTTVIQDIINRATRLSKEVPTRGRITPMLMEQSMLPTKDRVIPKLCTLIYQTLSIKFPPYFKELLLARQPLG